ncbi:hypothetical protein [Nesterenkonia flava]|uniref:Polysaccharide pyruvyl transferase domain-containing protein n=1 Tax=Nesterenkonia flava TaxID=469799 RepID=A0ABU1FSN9_9MICC|nr:hypothetical protein [Nesterenkonia flava]MDR5711685.1 hypothetical protein [Nesterenkonia flava]
MSENSVQDVFIHLGGQDDNLGDSALRAAYFEAAQGEGRRFHVHFEGQTTDYLTGIPLKPEHLVYNDRAEWIAASNSCRRAVMLFNAGEINPGRAYPPRHTAIQLRNIVERDGLVLFAGTGMKDPSKVNGEAFHPVLRNAPVASWRDALSRDAAGFGTVAPDWAYALGTPTAEWASVNARPLLAVSLRFDRPLPDQTWIEAVRSLAEQTSTRIVTLAQVARDAPRAVRLAEMLGGEYLTPPSMKHADLDSHARSVYGEALAVISDRAHGLIIGASEGAYPIGSASNPQKIKRLLAAAGLGDLVGHYQELPEFAAQLEHRLSGFAPAIDTARAEIADLTGRINAAMDAAR